MGTASPLPSDPLIKERDTRQRRAIQRVFRDADRPLSPQEVLDAATREVPRLGTATVYRTVKTLVDRGWLVPVAMPGEAPRYEVAGKGHHHHFHCKGCDRVFELHGCPEDLEFLTPQGFRLETHELVLYGSCSDCLKGS